MNFFLPLRSLGSAFHVAMNGATAFKKVIKLLNEEEQIRNLTVDTRINSITITNLNFSYDNKVILKDINLSFEKGLYSLVGISGSGKSTIAKLLANINKNYICNDYQEETGVKVKSMAWFKKQLATYCNNHNIEINPEFIVPKGTRNRQWDDGKLCEHFYFRKK